MFKCLKCGLCCLETEMPLTWDDIRRIENLGYSLKDFAVKNEDGIYVLRNVKGACFFLDKGSKLCKIYPYRPMGCRIYPVIYDIDRETAMVDPACPAASTMSSEELKIRTRLLLQVLAELGII